jgi:hypothetical protein
MPPDTHVTISVKVPVALAKRLDKVRRHLTMLDPEGRSFSRQEVLVVLLLWLLDYKRITRYARPLPEQLALDRYVDPLASLWSEDD